MSESKDPHISDADWEEYHKCEKGTESGACLTGHEGKYQEKNSCSYRWQGLEVSKELRKDIYNGAHDKYEKKNGGIATSAYKTEKGSKYPSKYVNELAPPEEGDWDLDGPKRPIKRTMINRCKDFIPIGRNFTVDRWPYWHNGHHMIPKALLNLLIDESGKGDKANPNCPLLIRRGLMKAKYNVNHKGNMIILPQDMNVGKVLGLPRHLILVELKGNDPEEIARAERMSHEAYDQFVSDKVRPIIKGFQKNIGNKNCDAAIPDLAKEDLEDVSGEVYERIVKFGKIAAGEPIADIAKKK